MGTVVLSKTKKTDIFTPMCDEGHSQGCFVVDVGDSEDVFLLDSKGWLSRVEWSDKGLCVEPEMFMYNGEMVAKTECEQCLSKGVPRKIYRWKLDFTFGLLRHVWRQPSEVPDIEMRALQEPLSNHL